MMFQKQEEKRTRWNEIIQNKERNIENSFKHQKDLMIKQTKQDKEKAKKFYFNLMGESMIKNRLNTTTPYNQKIKS